MAPALLQRAIYRRGERGERRFGRAVEALLAGQQAGVRCLGLPFENSRQHQ